MANGAGGLGVNKAGLNQLKQRLLFVLLGIVVFRLGSHVPVPGLDPVKLANLFNSTQNTLLGVFNMFSGGALSRLSVFAVGIMPYISTSIIMQLFSNVLPSLEQLKKEGEAGRRKINQYTRYGTLALAIFQSMGMSRWLVSKGVVIDPSFTFYFTATVTLVTGTMFLMWLGEQMTERGVGNGISMIIFAGIVSGFPGAIGQVLDSVKDGQLQGIAVVTIAFIVFAVTSFVVFMERGQRRITVNYAQRTQGRKMYAAQQSHLPMKINMSGVIPPIFAMSIIVMPATLATMLGSFQGMQWLGELSVHLAPGNTPYYICYAFAIIFFAFFYTALVFNPKDTADNLKRSGAFIPGIRPGEQTSKYIDTVMSRLTLVGAGYLILVCLLPEIIMYNWHVPFFGGTSLLIVVVVIMDFMAQVQSHLMSHQYESLMKKANLKGKSPTGGAF